MPKQSPAIKKFYSDRKEILGLLLNVIEEVPELTIPQILVTLLRSKGGVQAYHWTDSEFIEKIRLFQLDIFENPLDPVIEEKDF